MDTRQSAGRRLKIEGEQKFKQQSYLQTHKVGNVSIITTFVFSDIIIFLQYQLMLVNVKSGCMTITFYG